MPPNLDRRTCLNALLQFLFGPEPIHVRRTVWTAAFLPQRVGASGDLSPCQPRALGLNIFYFLLCSVLTGPAFVSFNPFPLQLRYIFSRLQRVS